MKLLQEHHSLAIRPRRSRHYCILQENYTSNTCPLSAQSNVLILVFPQSSGHTDNWHSLLQLVIHTQCQNEDHVPLPVIYISACTETTNKGLYFHVNPITFIITMNYYKMLLTHWIGFSITGKAGYSPIHEISQGKTIGKHLHHWPGATEMTAPSCTEKLPIFHQIYTKKCTITVICAETWLHTDCSNIRTTIFQGHNTAIQYLKIIH